MHKSLSRLADAAGALSVQAHGRLPPVLDWQPDLRGDLDLRIGANGTWYYQGSPIGRQRLIDLFASILRREGDQYYLVTPAEKWRIRVDDVPFHVVDVERATVRGQQRLTFSTTTGDRVVAGSAHPLTVGEDAVSGQPDPRILIRHGMQGRLNRRTYYELCEMAEEGRVHGERVHGVSSDGRFFALV